MDEDKIVDLEPGEWKSGPKGPEPFFGPNWWVIPGFFALVAFLTYFGGEGSPAWVRAIALALR